jgi:hypothetical protein
MPYLATNYEILIKTEPFLKFKKELFKQFLKKNKKKEDVLRRKFYKILELYLGDKKIDKEDFKGVNIKCIIKELDLKFKKKKEGSFIMQGMNIGYIVNRKIQWIRYENKYSEDEVTTFL